MSLPPPPAEEENLSSPAPMNYHPTLTDTAVAGEEVFVYDRDDRWRNEGDDDDDDRCTCTKCLYPNGVVFLALSQILLTIATSLSLATQLDCKLVQIEPIPALALLPSFNSTRNDTNTSSSNNTLSFSSNPSQVLDAWSMTWTDRQEEWLRLNLTNRLPSWFFLPETTDETFTLAPRGLGFYTFQIPAHAVIVSNKSTSKSRPTNSSGKCYWVVDDVHITGPEINAYMQFLGKDWKLGQTTGALAALWALILMIWVLFMSCWAHVRSWRWLIGLMLVLGVVPLQSLTLTVLPSGFCEDLDCSWYTSATYCVTALSLFFVSGILFFFMHDYPGYRRRRRRRGAPKSGQEVPGVVSPAAGEEMVGGRIMMVPKDEPAPVQVGFDDELAAPSVDPLLVTPLQSSMAVTGLDGGGVSRIPETSPVYLGDGSLADAQEVSPRDFVATMPMSNPDDDDDVDKRTLNR